MGRLAEKRVLDGRGMEKLLKNSNKTIDNDDKESLRRDTQGFKTMQKENETGQLQRRASLKCF